MAVGAGLVEHDDLARRDIAHIAGADHVERTGFRGQDRATIEIAQHQWTNAERVARADQLLVGQADQRVAAFDCAQGLDEAGDETAALGLGYQMQDDLGVGGRLHHGAVAHQLTAERQAVGEVAVVADRETAGIELGEQRLDVAQDGGAGRGIADMADRGIAGQAFYDFAAGESVADETEPAFGMKTAAVEGDDAGGFLAAVLERVQPECGDGSGVRMAKNTEYATFLAKRITVQIGVSEVRMSERVLCLPRLANLTKVQIKLAGGIGRALHLVHHASHQADFNFPRVSRSAFSGCRGQAYYNHRHR